jgi:hypothetical protein
VTSCDVERSILCYKMMPSQVRDHSPLKAWKKHVFIQCNPINNWNWIQPWIYYILSSSFKPRSFIYMFWEKFKNNFLFIGTHTSTLHACCWD